jgi:hypothetical protein
MTRRIPTRLFVALLAAGAAACADSTAPRAGVTEAMLTRDVATDVAEAASQNLDQMGDVELLVGLPLASSPLGSSSPFGNCTWDAGTRSYGCPTVTTPQGLTLKRWFEIEAGGTSQQLYDPLTTEAIVMSGSLTGTITQPDRTTWVSHGFALMVSGLAGTETQRTWRGSSSRDDSVHVNADGVARSVRLLSDDKINDVVYKLPRSQFPFPQSGTMTHDVTVIANVPDGTEETNRRGFRHVVVTFNGTRTASVLVGDKPCTLDLVTRRMSCN